MNVLWLARTGGEEAQFGNRGIESILADRWSLTHARCQEKYLLF
jgi:hypothetical protein